MSSRHQQHWDSYRVRGKSKMEMNYGLRGVWGEWTERVSGYDALLAEIFHINQMCRLIGVPGLFRCDYSRETRSDNGDSPLDEPKGFGLLMVPRRSTFLSSIRFSTRLLRRTSTGISSLPNISNSKRRPQAATENSQRDAAFARGMVDEIHSDRGRERPCHNRRTS